VEKMNEENKEKVEEEEVKKKGGDNKWQRNYL